MKSVKVFRLLPLFLVLVIAVGSTASTEAKGKRKRSHYAAPLAAQVTVGGPAAPKSDSVCPMYVWANHGSYCSYYSLIQITCQPVSYDSTDCNLQASGCGSDATGCLAAFKLRDSQLDQAGYGRTEDDKAQKVDVAFPPPNANVKDLDITKVGAFTVKFPNTGRGPIFAQVWIAKVAPKSSPNRPAYPTTVVSRGLEIQPVVEVDFDFTVLPIGAASPITVVAPHAYDCKLPFTESPIRIITHRSTQSEMK
ncbi:MAG: hypothetical protein JWM11_4933 [Planctomycetaceae bacterium]|nr:hypothetical protein [Planctomycetaceae bacterium]